MKPIRPALRSPRLRRGVAALLLAPAAAWPQADVPSAAAPEARRAGNPWQAPEIRHDGGVAYVTGGATDAGRTVTSRLGQDMNLALRFERADGAPLADVAVAVTDWRGETVLDLHSADPLLYAQLEPGRYRVAATVHGRTQVRDVEVPGDGRTAAAFRWDDPLPRQR